MNDLADSGIMDPCESICRSFPRIQVGSSPRCCPRIVAAFCMESRPLLSNFKNWIKPANCASLKAKDISPLLNELLICTKNSDLYDVDSIVKKQLLHLDM